MLSGETIPRLLEIGALARSEVFADHSTFKRIFGAYYAERPRKYIEIVRANVELTAAEQEVELLARATPAANAASTRVMAAVESAVATQVLRAAETRRAVA